MGTSMVMSMGVLSPSLGQLFSIEKACSSPNKHVSVPETGVCTRAAGAAGD